MKAQYDLKYKEVFYLVLEHYDQEMQMITEFIPAEFVSAKIRGIDDIYKFRRLDTGDFIEITRDKVISQEELKDKIIAARRQATMYNHIENIEGNYEKLGHLASEACNTTLELIRMLDRDSELMRKRYMVYRLLKNLRLSDKIIANIMNRTRATMDNLKNKFNDSHYTDEKFRDEYEKAKNKFKSLKKEKQNDNRNN